MASICSPTLIFSDSRLHRNGHRDVCDRIGLLTSTLKRVSLFSTVFFHWWLPIMLPWSISELFSRIARVYNLLALCSSTWMCWQWVWPKFHSLSSAHHLIGTYFLTTRSDKRMCLSTRLYGIFFQGYMYVWSIEQVQTKRKGLAGSTRSMLCAYNCFILRMYSWYFDFSFVHMYITYFWLPVLAPIIKKVVVVSHFMQCKFENDACFCWAYGIKF